jgi:hypothetical protein
MEGRAASSNIRISRSSTRYARMRTVLSLACMILILVVIPQASSAPVQKKDGTTKRHVIRHWHGYGFLPGYRPPEVIERERAQHYYGLYGHQYYGPAWPGFYRGRWNGGGFGPCWTQTPIGPMWNCGR